MWFKDIIDTLFAIGLFINALLFIPQILKLLKEKESKDLSSITFVGFCLIQLLAIIYGYLHEDYILLFGYLLSLLTCGTATVLIFVYRNGREG